MSILLLLFFGFIAGMFVATGVARPAVGCLILAAVPIVTIAYIYWWQGENPDKLRSTSGLDFVFGALWPSLGAIVGLLVGKALQERPGP